MQLSYAVGRRQWQDIYSTWTIEDGEEKKLKTYYDKFEEYCKPKSRYVFKSRVQKENESSEQFVTELRL